MIRRTLVPVIIALVIAAMLGGGYAIVVSNRGVDSQQDTPTGFFH